MEERGGGWAIFLIKESCLTCLIHFTNTLLLKMSYKTVFQEDLDLFREPGRIYIAGPTASGKSHIIKNLIEVYHVKFDRIVICGSSESNYNFDKELTNTVIFRDEFVNPYQEKITPECRLLIIYDDLYHLVTNDINVLKAHAAGRHSAISVIISSQNLFSKIGKYNRDILLNVSHIILTRQRDINSVDVLARQLVGSSKVKQFRKAYETAVGSKYGHLLIDLRPNTPNEVMIRSDIFCEKSPFSSAYEI